MSINNQTESEEIETIKVISDSSILCVHISSLYLKQKFSDIILIVNGQKLYAHKVILATRSKYFEALLYGGLLESVQSEITIPDAPPAAFKILLKYVYTGCMTIVPSNIDLTLKVLGLAHKYCFKDLETSIVNELKLLLNLQNICYILNIANLYCLTELTEACHFFLDNHGSEIMTSDRVTKLTQAAIVELLQRDTFFVPETEIFKAVTKWCQVNHDKDNLVIKSVRLSWLTVADIVSIVWPTGQIKNETLLSAIAEIVNVKPRKSSCRAQLVLNENIATNEKGSEVLHGLNGAFLLNGNRDVQKYAHHCISDNNGITIKLGVPSIINHIHMLLFDLDSRYYCYYIEVSMDSKNWKKVVDYTHCSCRSHQNLYFDKQIAQYIRVVGTFTTVENGFHMVYFETAYKSELPKLLNGIICPTSNVATLAEGAMVIEGIQPHNLLNGDTKNYNGSSGYTYHAIGSGSIIIQLAQPYMLSSMSILLWDQDERTYKYYVETSVNKSDWEMVVDYRKKNCKSWQHIRFTKKPVVFIKLVGTFNSENTSFHCVHFECPSSIVGDDNDTIFDWDEEGEENQ